MSIVPASAAGRNDPPRYNVAPTQDVGFVCHDEGERVVKDGRWWLVPIWAKEIPKYPMFNARSETAQEKSSFRDSFKRKRCLIPASGYYEWTKAEDGGKDPHAIYLPDREPFMFAGLWAYNHNLETTSCTILTAEAHPKIEHLHDRMPVILEAEHFDDWLSPEANPKALKSLLAHNRGSELVSHRVGREVNNSRAKGSQLLAPLDEAQR